MKMLVAPTALAVLLLSCLALAAAPWAEVPPAPLPAPLADATSGTPQVLVASTTYALTGDNWALHGCFQPCLCPLLITGDMVGQFEMEVTEQSPELTVYAVTDIDWDVYAFRTGEYLYAVTGSGTYEVHTLPEGGQTQRMILTLIYNETAHELDSGEVVLDPGQPFAVFMSEVEIPCLRDAFFIQAAPVMPLDAAGVRVEK